MVGECMQRRNHKQIQSNDQIPKHEDLYNKDYSLLIPTYKHLSTCRTCKGNTITEVTDSIIHINNIYKYGSYGEENSYHRDNYCVIPVSVPSMALKKTSQYVLDSDTIKDKVPKISSMFNLEYDNTFFWEKGNSLADVFKAALGSSYSDDPFTGDCQCNPEYDKYKEDICTDGSCHNMEGPLDHVLVATTDISDEYSYIWEDIWDMSIIQTISPTRRPKKEDESSSSSAGDESEAGGRVFLCKLEDGPQGTGGAVIISVDGNGSVSPSGSIAVNLVSI